MPAQISRDNFLDTIESLFEARADIVLVCGDPGIGKTTLLSQYAARHPLTSLQLFIRPLSRLAYDPQMLLSELYEQACNFANYPAAAETQAITPAMMSDVFRTLHRRSARTRAYWTIVIDGLDEVPPEDNELRRLFLELLPFGLPSLRFLLSGSLALPRHKPREVQLAPFTLDDTTRYLDGAATPEQAAEIHKTCRGIPGHLASVLRVIAGGVSAETLIAHFPRTIPDLFELEWGQVDHTNDVLLDALVFLTLERSNHPLPDIARLVGTSATELTDAMSRLRFLAIDGESVEYSSDAFRKFASAKLEKRKKKVRSLILDDLIRTHNVNPTAPDSTLIPEYMHDLGRHDDLLAFLTPSYFNSVVDQTKSLTALATRNELGLRTAESLARDGDLARFALQSANAASLVAASGWRSEIEARVRLGDIEGAKALANGAPLKEVRLRQLALLARTVRSAGRVIDDDVLSEIDTLFDDVHHSVTGDNSQLAADLIYSRPQLAIRLIEQASQSATRRAKSRLLVATAAAAANTSGSDESARLFTEAGAKIAASIGDPAVQDLGRVAWALYGTYSAQEMIAEVERVSEPRIRVELLRYWLATNAEKPDAAQLLHYALNVTIAASEVTPSAAVLFDFAKPLRHIEDDGERKRLVDILQGLLGSAERVGPTSQFIGLRVRLAAALARTDPTAARGALNELTDHVRDIDGLHVRAECLARIAIALRDPALSGALVQGPEMYETIVLDLHAVVADLLSKSADHEMATRAIIRILVPRAIDVAFAIAAALNTQGRRDEAHATILEEMLRGPFSDSNFATVMQTVARLSSDGTRQQHLPSIAVWALEADTQPSPGVVQSLEGALASLESPVERCRLHCLLYGYYAARQQDPRKAHELKAMREAWSRIDSLWARIDVAFFIARDLADTDRDVAVEFLQEADKFRRDVGRASDSAATTIVRSINLAVRALAGLFPGRLDSNEDLARIEDMIRSIPIRHAQLAIWSDIAFRYWAAARTDDCRRILSSHVIQPLLGLARTAPDGFFHALRYAVAPMYFTHPNQLEEVVARLDSARQEECWHLVFKAVYRRWQPLDSYSMKGYEHELTYEESLSLIGVLERLHSDSNVYECIETLAQSITAKVNKSRFTREQVRMLADRIDTISTRKLPDPHGIGHDGYKILAQACAARMRGDHEDKWKALLARAKAVPNAADTVFVLAGLSALMPNSLRALRTQGFREALAGVTAIALPAERAERLRSMGMSAYECGDIAVAKTCIHEAWVASWKRAEDVGLDAERRNIIDEAYRIDPKLAEELIATSDDDPARREARKRSAEQLARLQREKDRSGHGKLSADGGWDDELASAAWRSLGQLNARRVTPLTRERAREWISLASRADVERTYPVFAFVVESLVQRLARTPEAALLRQVFDGIVLALEVAIRIEVRAARWMPLVSTAPADDSSIVIRAGERDKGLRYIAAWIERAGGDEIVICDGYFTLHDLEVLRIVKEVAPMARVRILTSQSAQANAHVDPPYEEAYRHHWRQHVLAEDPPDVEIVIVGREGDNTLPIHDRWWFCGNSGLRSGTSFNGLGVRESELAILSHQEVLARRRDVDMYMTRASRDVDGRRLRYTLFTL